MNGAPRLDRKAQSPRIEAQLHLDGCPLGPVLDPFETQDEAVAAYLADWDTPLAPRGGFPLESGLAVVREGAQTVLEWTRTNSERAVATGSPPLARLQRDCLRAADERKGASPQ